MELGHDGQILGQGFAFAAGKCRGQVFDAVVGEFGGSFQFHGGSSFFDWERTETNKSFQTATVGMGSANLALAARCQRADVAFDCFKKKAPLRTERSG